MTPEPEDKRQTQWTTITKGDPESEFRGFVSQYPDMFAGDRPAAPGAPVQEEFPQQEEPDEDEDTSIWRSAIEGVFGAVGAIIPDPVKDVFESYGETVGSQAGMYASSMRAQQELGMTPIPILGQFREGVREKQAEILGVEPGFSAWDPRGLAPGLFEGDRQKRFTAALAKYHDEREKLFWGEKFLTELLTPTELGLILFPIRGARNVAKLAGLGGTIGRRGIKRGIADEDALGDEIVRQSSVISSEADAIREGAMPLNDLSWYTNQVVTTDDPILKLLVAKTGINPSLAGNTESQRLMAAYVRKHVDAEELQKLYIAAHLDVFAGKYTGRLGDYLPLEKDGIVKGTKYRWEDVFSSPDDRRWVHVSGRGTKFREYINAYHQLLDTADNWRNATALPAIKKITGEEGWFWVPRQVRTIRGYEVPTPTNYRAKRMHEETTSGLHRGIEYGNDPRSNIALHLRQTVREILDQDLGDTMAAKFPNIPREELLSRSVRDFSKSAAANLAVAARENNFWKDLYKAGSQARKIRRESVAARAAGRAATDPLEQPIKFPEEVPPTAAPAPTAAPTPTAEELDLVKEGRVYYPKNIEGFADTSESAVEKVKIHGEDRFITKLYFGGGLGNSWFEYTGPATRGWDKHSGIYSKKAMIEKLRQAPPTAAPAPTAAPVVGVKVMITNKDKAALKDMGFSDDQIKKMKPDEVGEHLSGAEAAPPPTAAPADWSPRVAVDINPPLPEGLAVRAFYGGEKFGLTKTGQARRIQVTFDRDIDKALYLIGQGVRTGRAGRKKARESHNRLVNFVMRETKQTEGSVRNLAESMVRRVDQIAQDAQAGTRTLDVPGPARAVRPGAERYQIGISPATIEGQRQTPFFGAEARGIVDRASKEMDDYFTKYAGRVTAPGNKPGIQRVEAQFNESVELGREYMETRLQNAGFDRVMVRPNLGKFGALEPSLYATARVTPGMEDDFLRNVADIADVDFAQSSVMITKDVGDDVIHGIVRDKSGNPLYSIEPSVRFIRQGGGKLSLRMIDDLSKAANKVGLAGFAVLPNRTGIDIFNVSFYNPDTGKFLEMVNNLYGNTRFKRIFGSATKKVGAKRLWHFGVDGEDGLVGYNQLRSTDDATKAARSGRATAADGTATSKLDDSQKTRLSQQRFDVYSVSPGARKTSVAQSFTAADRYSSKVAKAAAANYRRAARANGRAKKAVEEELEVIRQAKAAPGALFGYAPETIGIKTWTGRGAGAGRFFPVEIIEDLEEGIKRLYTPVGGLYKIPEAAGQAARFLSAGMDWAMPLTHGLMLLGRRPDQWAKVVYHHTRAFFAPGVQARDIKENFKVYQAMIRNGISIGDPEVFKAIEEGGILSPGAILEFLLPEGVGHSARNFARFGGKQTFGRFQAQYSMGLRTMRRLMWESHIPNWKGSEQQLARYIRNMSGALDSRALGVGPKGAAVESTWLAFSPRLLRSTVSLFYMATKFWTKEGFEALRSLSQLAMGAVAMYYMTGLALGKSHEEIFEGLDPTKGKRFLSHNINGDWIGVGGQVRAISQALIAITAAAGGGENAGKLLELNAYENPIIKLWFSRGAPFLRMTQAGLEYASGGKYDVAPYDNIDSAPDLMKHLGTSFVPFSLQGVIEGEQAVTTGFAFQGFRTSPRTPSEERDEARAIAMIRIGYSGKYDDLPQDLQRYVNGQEEVIDAQAFVNERSRERGSGYQVYHDKKERLNREFRNMVIRLSKSEKLSDFRRRYGELQGKRVSARDNLRAIHAEDLEWIDELPPASHPFDIAMEDYASEIMDPALENPLTGDYDFDERMRRERAFQATYGDAMLRRIRKYIYENQTPIEEELRTVRNFLKPYWQIKERFLNRYPRARAMLDQIEQNQKPGGNLATALRLSKHPLMAQYRRYVRAQREALRRRSPTIGKYLIAWYGYNPSNSRELTTARSYLSNMRRLIDSVDVKEEVPA